MLGNVRWLFFDVGSTLMNEEKAYEHRFRDIAAAAEEPYDKIYGIAMDFYRQNKKGDLETAKLFGLPKLKWYREDEALYEDAKECLGQLHETYKIGVIANQAAGTEARLAQHGIMQYIDLVVASAEEGVAKPDRRIFETALERSGCKPEDAVMIGDRIDNDIVPANLLGMHTIWIRQGYGKYWKITQDIERADFSVNRLMELCDILLLSDEEFLSVLQEKYGVMPPGPYDQDWEFTAGEAGHVEEYIDFYDAYPLTSSQKTAMINMIIQGFDDLLWEETDADFLNQLWDRIKRILLTEKQLHYDTIQYWSCLEMELEEDRFIVSGYMRELL